MTSDILTEPIVITDIFASGLAEAENLGDGNMRFTLFTVQKSHADYAETYEKVIVARIVMPMMAVHHAVQLTIAASAGIPKWAKVAN